MLLHSTYEVLTYSYIEEDTLVGLQLAAALNGSIDAVLYGLAGQLLVGLGRKITGVLKCIFCLLTW